MDGWAEGQKNGKRREEGILIGSSTVHSEEESGGGRKHCTHPQIGNTAFSMIILHQIFQRFWVVLFHTHTFID